MPMGASSRRLVVAVVAVMTAAIAVIFGPALGAAADRSAGYHNPVTGGYSIDFPDPSLMMGKDGYWYAYSTGGPYDQTGTTGDPLKIARSSDLVHWQGLGSVFNSSNMPTWGVASSCCWAPDIRYLNGHYLLYFAMPGTNVAPTRFSPAIGVATAPTPAGPWKDSGAPVIPARPAAGGGYQTVIDPAEFTDRDGSRYMYWGSYGSGIRVSKLSDDGLHQVGQPRQVTTDRFEGAYVIRRGDWYYLFGSSANCCAGPTTGYTVFTGRARSPFGPFLDRDGHSLLASRSGGTVVVAPNGNRWVGTGHNAMATDLAGQTWLAYHAVDKYNPYLQTNPGYTMRPMLLDRLDWIDGWPTVRGGQWASDQDTPAPAARTTVDDRFDSAAATAQTFPTGSGELTVRPASANSTDSGGFATLAGAPGLAIAGAAVPGDQRVEADVRLPDGKGAGGVVARYRGPADQAQVTIDAAHRALTATAVTDGRTQTAVQPLPAGFDVTAFHNLAVEVRDDTLTASVSDARLGDPYAEVALTLPSSLRGGTRTGLVAIGGADFDNVAAGPLYEAQTRVVPPPRVGSVEAAYSDDFTGPLSPAWTWVRPDPSAKIGPGGLTWPTETQDLTGTGSTQAGVLLRDAPAQGSWVLETKLHLDVGVDTNRNYQQAGLIVYADDNTFLRLDHVAVGDTRITEFGKKMPVNGLISWGGAVLGPPADTTWLRIASHVDPSSGERVYQGGSSDDGVHWTWGAAWTLPAGTHTRIGLVSQGSTPATTRQYGPATAVFSYFHLREG